jgi:hypothetical protein
MQQEIIVIARTGKKPSFTIAVLFARPTEDVKGKKVDVVGYWVLLEFDTKGEVKANRPLCPVPHLL